MQYQPSHVVGVMGQDISATRSPRIHEDDAAALCMRPDRDQMLARLHASIASEQAS